MNFLRPVFEGQIRAEGNVLHRGRSVALVESILKNSEGKEIARGTATQMIFVGQIDVAFIDKPDPHISSLGARGAGEIGMTGVAAAIANAVYHATGIRVRNLPITPEKLLV